MRTFFTIAAMIVLSGCNHYYKANQLPTPDNLTKAVALDSLRNEKRYFILRNGEKAYFMRNAHIDVQSKSIVSLLQNPGVDHRLYLMNGKSGDFQFRNNVPNETHVLDEVHLYMLPDSLLTVGRSYSLAFDNIQMIEAIEKDKGRTRGSTFLGLLVGFLASAGIITLFVGYGLDIF